MPVLTVGYSIVANFSDSSGPLSKPLGVFALVMINVIAVDNLRSLTVGAEYGFAMVFFYLLAAVLFFIPTILISAELATGWPSTGGVYVWVKEAFGAKAGFLCIWMQWIYNVVWYPTIFAFIAGVVAYLIDPALTNNKTFMLSVILLSYWCMTILNCLGLKVSQIICTLGAIFGTIFPMLFIAVLGLIWVSLGKPTAIHFSVHDFFPSLNNLKNIAFFTNILFGLMGMEMSAVHAGDVKNPRKDYPRALLLSTLIILVTLICSCLAIALVIPVKDLNLVSGLIDAFGIFFRAYQLDWFVPIIAVLIILGSISGASAWILGPARGLLVAVKDSELPNYFKRINKKNMPVGILMTQGIIVTVLCTVFLIMPTVNSSYWILSNLTAQLALIFYILMFAAAIRLRYKHALVARSFKIPGGMIGIWVVGMIGIVTCFLAIIIGFIPPNQVAIGKVASYEAILLGGIFLCCLVPFLLRKKVNA